MTFLSLFSPLQSLCCSLLKLTRHDPTSGPLHWLFPWPETLFPLIPTWPTLPSPSSLYLNVTFSLRPSLFSSAACPSSSTLDPLSLFPCSNISFPQPIQSSNIPYTFLIMFIFCYSLLECKLYKGSDHSLFFFTAVSPAPKNSVWGLPWWPSG